MALSIDKDGNIPVAAQAITLNSVPRGSGFLRMKDMFGNPPVFEVLGL
jgi:hypothetical protein